MSAIIIATAMRKGGVGKTTTTLALGSELARAGGKVLLIDIDPQASLTEGIGVPHDQIDGTIYEAMLDPTVAEHVTITTEFGVDIIPATATLDGAADQFAGRFAKELLLRTALAPLRSAYDYIIIDTPPGLGIYTINALVAADTVLVPLQAHVAAMDQMPQMEETIMMVRQLNPSLTIGGILMTMIGRTNITAGIEAAARARYGDLVFQATIPYSVKMIEAPAAGQPVTIYAPESSGALAYRAFAREVQSRWGMEGGRDAT